MGKDGGNAGDLPLSLKVKNTFIDVNSSFVEDDAGDDDDGAFLEGIITRRQASEPLPYIHRQISGGSFHRAPGMDLRTPVAALVPAGLLEEDAEADEGIEGEEGEEPETEKDPCWIMDTQVGRQETEPFWPGQPMEHPDPEMASMPWRLLGGRGSAAEQGSYQAAAAEQSSYQAAAAEQGSYQAGLWLFQMPGAAGSHGADVGNQLPMMGGRSGSMPSPEWAGIHTVMMRNLPNKYTQQMLLEELNQSGFLGTFDFMYLPIDPETSANRGYAFINFTDPSFAWMLRMTYEGRKMARFNSDKVVSVAPAALQGFEANYAHYSTARVNRGDPAARPLFLRESTMRYHPGKHDGGRRRGGRRNAGSLIDLAAWQQGQKGGFSPDMAQQQAPWNMAGLGGGKGHGQPGGGAGASAGKKASEAARGQPVPKFCPHCGGSCKPEFRFCQFCGSSLSF